MGILRDPVAALSVTVGNSVPLGFAWVFNIHDECACGIVIADIAFEAGSKIRAQGEAVLVQGPLDIKERMRDVDSNPGGRSVIFVLMFREVFSKQ